MRIMTKNYIKNPHPAKRFKSIDRNVRHDDDFTRSQQELADTQKMSNILKHLTASHKKMRPERNKYHNKMGPNIPRPT